MASWRSVSVFIEVIIDNSRSLDIVAKLVTY